ncbi:hypothetical protein MMC17_009902 [Xylographa soralifera]|nr:hypothetical protein [Xylographa soralifera]
MDPVTVLSIVSGSIGLAAKCASVAQQLYNIATKFKQAELTIRAVGEECEIIRLAWTRIEKWVVGWANDAAADQELLNRLHRSIETGSMIISALEDSLLSIGDAPNSSGFGWRSRIVWNENTLSGPQQRIRGLVASVHLLLDVLKLPIAINRHELLEKKDSILRRSDESAWTIVQSRPSTVVSSARRRQSVESTEYFYHEFGFDDQLFTARVYKRNYGNIEFKRNYNNSKLKQQNDEYPTTQHEQVLDIDETQSVQVQATPSVLSMERDEIHFNDPDFSDVETTCSVRTKHTGSSHRTSTTQDYYEESAHPQDSNSLHLIEMTGHHEDGLDLIVQPFAKRPDDSILNPVDTWHLDLAAAQGRYDVLETLLQQPSANLFSKWKETSFFNACKQGNEAMVQFHLENGIIMHLRESSTIRLPPAIYVTASHGHVGVAKLLLAAGADIDANHNDGRKPLHRAVTAQHVGMVAFLLENRASVNCRDYLGQQAIHFAASIGNVEITKLLLEAKASAVACDDTDSQPIHLAAHKGHLDIVAILLEAGASAVACDHDDRQPIHDAIHAQSVGIIDKLLEYRASINAVGSDGLSPIHIAVSILLNRSSSESTIRHLISKGASLELQNAEGYTPIQAVCDDREDHGSIVLLLLSLGAKPTVGATWSISPFGLATLHRHYATMSTILTYSGYDTLDPHIDLPAIHTLARGRRIGGTLAAYCLDDILALNVLLGHGMNFRGTSNRGKLALHRLADSSLELSETSASRKYAKEMTKLMLTHGADANAMNDNGRTPLYYAVRRKKWWLVQMLRNHGARELREKDSNYLYAKYGIMEPLNYAEDVI